MWLDFLCECANFVARFDCVVVAAAVAPVVVRRRYVCDGCRHSQFPNRRSPRHCRCYYS